MNRQVTRLTDVSPFVSAKQFVNICILINNQVAKGIGK